MPTADRLLEVFTADIGHLRDVPDSELSAPIAACPGWVGSDVVVHLGRVHDRALHLLAGNPFVPMDRWAEAPTDSPVQWARERAQTLGDRFAALDPDAEVATPIGPGTVRFWMRRMLHETTIHRWDVQTAVGEAVPIPADVGADGVDELFEVFGTLRAAAWSTAAPPVERTIHLHATDTEGEWLVRWGPNGMSFTREHAKGDVAVRGPGAALDLMMWNRLPRSGDAAEVDVFGDTDLLTRLVTAAAV